MLADYQLTKEQMELASANAVLLRQCSKLLRVPRERVADKVKAMVEELERNKREIQTA